MSAPPAALIDARHHWAYHADDGHEANHWEEPAKDDVGDDNPIEGHARRLKVTVETLCCFLLVFFLCHKL